MNEERVQEIVREELQRMKEEGTVIPAVVVAAPNQHNPINILEVLETQIHDLAKIVGKVDVQDSMAFQKQLTECIRLHGLFTGHLISH